MGASEKADGFFSDQRLTAGRQIAGTMA